MKWDNYQEFLKKIKEETAVSQVQTALSQFQNK